jgi:phosphoribosyl-AMP cyclohydrolase / phosphoribosyl-ATP pyrophosphohydrolase
MDEQAALTFDDDGLVTAVAQDAATGDVLMVAHMNREALQRTLASRQAWYWSRRRARLWRKGEQSGHTQQVEAVSADCDGDAVLLRVRQVGPACHTGHRSCFYRAVVQGRDGPAVDPEPGPAAGPSAAAVPVGPAREAGAEVLLEVAAVLADRRQHPREGSYSSRLFAEGLSRLNEKIMEEAAEVTRAARKETRGRFVQETADLWFHTLALLEFQGVSPAEVFAELAKRRR